MKRLSLLILAVAILGSAVGCCSSGGCGRPMLGMAQPYQSGYPAGIASGPGCGCGF